MRAILATAFLISGLVSSYSQDSISEGMPGSVFTIPAPQGETFEAVEDYEVITDLPLFLSRGFVAPNWDAHSFLAQEVARDLVIPDYVKRTGKPAPETASIEIASAAITKRGLNDLLVVSRLPGDCNENGCLFQVYAIKGKVWIKALEFRAVGMAYKDGREPGSTTIAAVGDEEVPSRLIEWDGQKFNE